MEVFSNYTASRQASSDRLILLISIPFIVSIGLIGNILTIIVLTNRKFKNNTTSVFLTALALSDAIYLLANAQINTWFEYVSTVNIRDHSDTLCKLLLYAVYVAKGYGSWTLVAVNLQRFLLVALPLKTKHYITTSRAKVTAGMLLAVMLLIFSSTAIMAGVNHAKSSAPGCRLSRNLCTVKTLNIFSLVFNSLLPCACILSSNTLLFYTVKHKQRCKLSDSDSLGLTITLVTLSVVYMALTMPISIMILYNTYTHPTADFPPYITILSAVLQMLDLLNSAINFILYCLSGQTFRAEMKQLVSNVMCYWNDNRVNQAP